MTNQETKNIYIPMKIQRKYNFENLNATQRYQIVFGGHGYEDYGENEILEFLHLVINLRLYLRDWVEYTNRGITRASHKEYLKYVEKLATDSDYKHAKFLTDLLDNTDRKYLGYKILDKKTERIYTPREILELCAAAELETTK